MRGPTGAAAPTDASCPTGRRLACWRQRGAHSSLLSGLPGAAALALMMVAGFALSLCSSSDAVIARSLASLAPSGALMGFMVFGPMMDVKNVALLASQFRISFVARLFVTVTIVAALVVGGSWWAGLLP